jgi:predicted GIY-YIG superfamily endonuclease
MPYYVYRLIANNNHSNIKYHYIGSTPTPKKRIRQHNGFIKGGAKCTKSKLNCISIDPNTSLKWNFQWLIMTFLNNKNALTLEWHLKYPFNVIPSKHKQKKTNFNVILNDEIFKTRCHYLSNDINIMLKQIDVTIQYVINKNNIVGDDQQMFVFIDRKFANDIHYQSINYKIIYWDELNSAIMDDILSHFDIFN